MLPPRLHFYGPYALCSETGDVLQNCVHKSSGGLYLWVVPQDAGGYKISYLGETSRSFYGRTKEHVIQTLGGNYRVIDAVQMRSGVERIIWNGMWRRDFRNRLPEFLRRYEELAPLIKEYLFGQSIFVCPLPAEQPFRRQIERALALEIRKDAKAATLFPADIRFTVPSEVFRPAAVSKVTISADRDVQGLPSELIF